MVQKLLGASGFLKPSSGVVCSGRAGEIRTHDLLHPMQAFYQAELRPDLFAERQSRPAGDADDGGMPLLCN